MITRLWRGWTATTEADAYEEFLMTELFPALHYDKPVLDPRARELLSRYDERALHFETALFDL